MKRRKSGESFFDELRKNIGSLGKMKSTDVHVMSINANYGRYQITIGPESGNGDQKKKIHLRPIEINGEIHHLFVSPHTVQPHPSKNEVLMNLKHTIILKELTVHFVDPEGDGRHLDLARTGDGSVHPKEFINMAGEEGERMLEKTMHSDKLPLAAYKIVQEDILKALKERRH